MLNLKLDRTLNLSTKNVNHIIIYNIQTERKDVFFADLLFILQANSHFHTTYQTPSLTSLGFYNFVRDFDGQ